MILRLNLVDCCGFDLAPDFDEFVKLGLIYGERVVLWDVISSRLLATTPLDSRSVCSRRSPGHEVSDAAAREHFEKAGRLPEVQTVARMIVETEAALELLPDSSQVSAQNLAVGQAASLRASRPVRSLGAGSSRY